MGLDEQRIQGVDWLGHRGAGVGLSIKSGGYDSHFHAHYRAIVATYFGTRAALHDAAPSSDTNSASHH